MGVEDQPRSNYSEAEGNASYGGWPGFHKIVGVEMCDRRHAIATAAWDAVRASLGAEGETEGGAAPSGGRGTDVVVSFVNGDIQETDVWDATHVYLSSLCFPPEVTRRISEILLANADAARSDGGGGSAGTGARLRVVAALSDLPLFERDGRWRRTTREIQMTWDGSRVRVYEYVGTAPVG